MRPGRHAADDGSFRRSGGVSAGIAAGRGALLLFIAVILGIFLLNETDEPGATTVRQERDPSTDGTTAPTLPPPTTSSTVAARDPKDVKVLAVNGTTTAGVGARAKDVLGRAGYNALSPTDAKTKPVKTSVVYYTPTYDRDAVAITAALGLPQTAIQPLPNPATNLVADTRGANVVVMVGEDLLPKLPAASATTTTAARNTTTTAARSSTTSSTTSTTARP